MGGSFTSVLWWVQKLWFSGSTMKPKKKKSRMKKKKKRAHVSWLWKRLSGPIRLKDEIHSQAWCVARNQSDLRWLKKKTAKADRHASVLYSHHRRDANTHTHTYIHTHTHTKAAQPKNISSLVSFFLIILLFIVVSTAMSLFSPAEIHQPVCILKQFLLFISSHLVSFFFFFFVEQNTA